MASPQGEAVFSSVARWPLHTGSVYEHTLMWPSALTTPDGGLGVGRVLYSPGSTFPSQWWHQNEAQAS